MTTMPFGENIVTDLPLCAGGADMYLQANELKIGMRATVEQLSHILNKGMDILSLMINHIDVSRKTGVLTLLCCPRESADADFYLAMREHFGLIQM